MMLVRMTSGSRLGAIIRNCELLALSPTWPLCFGRSMRQHTAPPMSHDPKHCSVTKAGHVISACKQGLLAHEAYFQAL